MIINNKIFLKHFMIIPRVSFNNQVVKIFCYKIVDQVNKIRINKNK